VSDPRLACPVTVLGRISIHCLYFALVPVRSLSWFVISSTLVYSYAYNQPCVFKPWVLSVLCSVLLDCVVCFITIENIVPANIFFHSFPLQGCWRLVILYFFNIYCGHTSPRQNCTSKQCQGNVHSNLTIVLVFFTSRTPIVGHYVLFPIYVPVLTEYVIHSKGGTKTPQVSQHTCMCLWVWKPADSYIFFSPCVCQLQGNADIPFRNGVIQRYGRLTLDLVVKHQARHFPCFCTFPLYWSFRLLALLQLNCSLTPAHTSCPQGSIESAATGRNRFSVPGPARKNKCWCIFQNVETMWKNIFGLFYI